MTTCLINVAQNQTAVYTSTDPRIMFSTKLNRIQRLVGTVLFLGEEQLGDVTAEVLAVGPVVCVQRPKPQFMFDSFFSLSSCSPERRKAT